MAIRNGFLVPKTKPPKPAAEEPSPRETAKDRFSSQAIDKSQLPGDTPRNHKHVELLVGEVGLPQSLFVKHLAKSERQNRGISLQGFATLIISPLCNCFAIAVQSDCGYRRTAALVRSNG
jgi:hypothetical protein